MKEYLEKAIKAVNSLIVILKTIFKIFKIVNTPVHSVEIIFQNILK